MSMSNEQALSALFERVEIG
ncbi:Protein of unknown function [Streptococcus thermophilus]|nr:Protein of unknown function [Streptococcus thermophilus]